MPKPYRTGAEKRNDEAMKAVIRDRMAVLLSNVDEQLEAFAFVQLGNPNAYCSGMVAELEQRKKFLQWIIAMHRPSDPETVNQYSTVEHGEIAANAEANPRDCDNASIHDIRPVGSDERQLNLYLQQDSRVVQPSDAERGG